MNRKRFDRQGHFWGQRFQSTVLADWEAVPDCMLYVELNPLRARLVEVPEERARASSLAASPPAEVS